MRRCHFNGDIDKEEYVRMAMGSRAKGRLLRLARGPVTLWHVYLFLVSLG